VPYIHPKKPEALTFEDFIKIDFFGGRPEFVIDVAKYISGYNLYENMGVLPDPS
jgi:hypothetical protein